MFDALFILKYYSQNSNNVLIHLLYMMVWVMDPFWNSMKNYLSKTLIDISCLCVIIFFMIIS